MVSYDGGHRFYVWWSAIPRKRILRQWIRTIGVQPSRRIQKFCNAPILYRSFVFSQSSYTNKLCSFYFSLANNIWIRLADINLSRSRFVKWLIIFARHFVSVASIWHTFAGRYRGINTSLRDRFNNCWVWFRKHESHAYTRVGFYVCNSIGLDGGV